MANILNPEIGNDRIYDREKVNVSKDLMADESGGMSSTMESNINQLAVAAKTTMKKRKATHDWNTKNKSFLNLYNDLYKLGIKNNKFFLKIYDRDLIGVDVYNQILPLDLQMKVLLEIIVNPWYFLREICRIPVDGKPIEPGGGSEFLADRNNIAAWYCFLNGIDHYQSKSRQLGKTQNAIAECDYAFHFGAMSSTFLFFNKDFALAKTNLYRLKCQRDMLPKWLQMKLSYKEDGSVDKGQDSATALRNPINGNSIKVMTKATSQENAIRLGRGDTAAFHYYDEYDFIPWNTEIESAAAFSYATASKNSRENNSLYGRLYTSTPGYLTTKAGKDADQAISQMLVWKDSFYDEPINKIKKLLNSKKCSGIMYIEHSWKQLKKSVEWYQMQCKLVKYDIDKILREIDLQRIQGNEMSPFKKSALAYIARNQKEAIDKVDYTKTLSPIYMYEKLNKKIHYILSIDPAEGLGLNNNAFSLINPHTECIAAEFKSPYISPPDFYRMLVKFMDNYCPHSMILIEANRGRELINRFLESKYRYQIWYNADKLKESMVLNTDQYGVARQNANRRRAQGFDTTPKTKDAMFKIIERLMEEDLGKIYTPFIVKDVASVQRKPNGRIVLGAGDDDEGVGHGDNLMSYLFGLYVLYNAKNLEEFGIYPGATEPIDDDRELTDDEKRQKIAQSIDNLSPELQELFRDVLNQTDPVRESKKYYQQVQNEIQEQDMARGEDPGMPDPRFYDGSAEDAMWSQIDQNILQSNFRNQSEDTEYGQSNNFNVNDWI